MRRSTSLTSTGVMRRPLVGSLTSRLRRLDAFLVAAERRGRQVELAPGQLGLGAAGGAFLLAVQRPVNRVYDQLPHRVLLEVVRVAQRREEDAGRLARRAGERLRPGDRLRQRVAV